MFLVFDGIFMFTIGRLLLLIMSPSLCEREVHVVVFVSLVIDSEPRLDVPRSWEGARAYLPSQALALWAVPLLVL